MAADLLLARTRVEATDPDPLPALLAHARAGVLSAAQSDAAFDLLLLKDAAMPRKKDRSTAWSVGENAKRAIAKIRGKK